MVCKESEVTSIILAGGRGSRLGREKSGELIAGEGLVKRAVGRLSPLNGEILIVISQRQSKASFVSYAEAKTVVDLYPETNSLGGIYTGLVHSTSFHNLVVACDMPLLNLDLLRHLIGLSSGFDIVVPRIGDMRQPLHAIYTKNCLLPIEIQIKQGNLRVTQLLDSVSVKYVEKDEMDRFDPEHLSFFNINTQEDLETARMLAERETK